MVKKYIDNIYIYMLIAFLFSLFVRYIYVLQVGDNSSMYWNNQIMINTNDGYYWAEGARDILAGAKGSYLSAVDYVPSQFTALLVKLLPFSFESIIFFISGVLSSLIVIPIILIGKYLKNLEMGFIAALLSSIAWSYYNRTMFGYYDTDMLNIVFPTILLSSLVWGYSVNSKYSLLIIGFDILAYRMWYPQSYALDLSIWAMVALYAIYQYFNKEDNSFSIKILIFMMVGMLYIPEFIRAISVLGLYFLFDKKIIKNKHIFYLLGFVIVVFITTGGVNPIISKLNSYLFRSEFNDVSKFHFYSVMQTIREANAIPFNTVANRISGNVAILILSIFGYGLLLLRYRVLIFSLPMVILGLLAQKAGLRFTIYAIVPLSLGIAYLITYLSNYINDKRLKYLFIALSAITILYPNLKHDINYGKYSKPVFTKQEVKDLINLDKISSSKDFVLTWWDYGYPIRYYSKINTLIDGGKHNEDNFIISKIFQSDSQLFARNFAKLAIGEYSKLADIYEKYRDNVDKAPKQYVFLDKSNKKYIHSPSDPVIKHLLGVDINKSIDVDDFLALLSSKEFKAPKNDRNIYLYMPYRMVNIFSTVMLFGNLDLNSGSKLRDYIFYPGYMRGKRGNKIILSNGLVFDSSKGIVYFGRKEVKVKLFVEAKVDKKGDIKLSPTPFYKDGSLAIVYLPHIYQFIVMDLKTFASNYVQMGLLGNYNKDLFELTIKSPYSRIYRVK